MTSSSPHLRCHEHRRTAALRQRTRLNIDTSLLDLPDEIIELILSKCPVKSAVRFKSVSKSWLSIISDPRFFRILQSKLSENQKSKFFIWTRPPSKDYGLYLIRLEDGEFQIESELGKPFGRPLCSCNGLFLLRANVDNKYVLWNPLIRKHIIIPAFNDSSPWWHDLCFDSITDDYKIVLFYRKCYTVYSCNNGCWGEMKDLPCDQIKGRHYAEGCLYYMDNGEIICFDARDGKLHKFRQPNEVEFLVKVRLEVVSGRLCLYGYKNHGAGRRLELWVMEDNGSFDKCWKKLISMEKVQSYISNKLIPLCFTREGDAVLLALTMRPQPGIYYKCFTYNYRKNCSFQVIHQVDSILKSLFHPNHFPYSENLYIPSSNIC